MNLFILIRVINPQLFTFVHVVVPGEVFPGVIVVAVHLLRYKEHFADGAAGGLEIVELVVYV